MPPRTTLSHTPKHAYKGLSHASDNYRLYQYADQAGQATILPRQLSLATATATGIKKINSPSPSLAPSLSVPSSPLRPTFLFILSHF